MISCLVFNLYVGELNVKLNLLGFVFWIWGLELKYRIINYIFNFKFVFLDIYCNINCKLLFFSFLKDINSIVKYILNFCSISLI